MSGQASSTIPGDSSPVMGSHAKSASDVADLIEAISRINNIDELIDAIASSDVDTDASTSGSMSGSGSGSASASASASDSNTASEPEPDSDEDNDAPVIQEIEDDSDDVVDIGDVDVDTAAVKSDLTDAQIIHEQALTKTYSSLLSNVDEAAELMLDADEELLDPSNDRLVLKPISKKFKVIWDLYKKQAEAFWTPEKIDFSNDKHDYSKLNPNIQEFIKKILAFFAGADSIVNINIREQFSKIKVKEAMVAYAFQEMMENIHSEVYSDMLDNIIVNPVEKHELINAFKTVDSIRDMIGWGEAWIESKRRIGFSIMAFTIFEGLMFSGAFAAIYWLKKQLGENKLQGLIGSNEFIARDEGMHTNFGCLMYDFVIHRLTADEASTMMKEAVIIAKRFNQDAIKIRLIGMNDELMGQYIECVADRLMVYLGYEKIYGSKVPDAFSFMEEIGILNKNNFFERRTSEYQMAHHAENTADWQFRIIDKY